MSRYKKKVRPAPKGRGAGAATRPIENDFRELCDKYEIRAALVILCEDNRLLVAGDEQVCHWLDRQNKGVKK